MNVYAFSLCLGPQDQMLPREAGGGSPGNLGRGVPLGSPNPQFHTLTRLHTRLLNSIPVVKPGL